MNHDISALISATHGKGKSACDAPTCGREIVLGNAMWIDRMVAASYCDVCGKTLQYHRDKAIGRGEVAPATFDDVEARFQRAMRRP